MWPDTLAFLPFFSVARTVNKVELEILVMCMFLESVTCGSSCPGPFPVPFVWSGKL